MGNTVYYGTTDTTFEQSASEHFNHTAIHERDHYGRKACHRDTA